MHGRIIVQIVDGLIERIDLDIFRQDDILHCHSDSLAPFHCTFFIRDIVALFADPQDRQCGRDAVFFQFRCFLCRLGIDRFCDFFSFQQFCHYSLSFTAS